MQRPLSILFYGVVLFVAGFWTLVWGFGQVGSEGGQVLVGWLAVLFGAFSIYAGPGMVIGSDGARSCALWMAGLQLAYVVLVAACAILGVINPNIAGVHLGAGGVIGLAVRLVLSMGALWSLSGPEALGFTCGHGHDHGHGNDHDHGHAADVHGSH